MTRFGLWRSDLVTRQLPDGRFGLLLPLEYESIAGRRFVVPPGTPTDYASVPRPWRNIVPRWSRSARAAVLHDYLYSHGARLDPPVSRAEADDLFCEALRTSGVDRLSAWLMWAAVRVGGAFSYTVA